MTTRRIIIALTTGIVLTVCLLLYHLLTEPQRLIEAAATFKGATIEQGAALYDANCRSCHGIRGDGVGQLGPSISDLHFFDNRLTEVGSSNSLEGYILSVIEHGRMMGTRPIYAGNGSTAVMPPWRIRQGGPLRNDEIRSLLAYIMNWQPTARGEVVLAQLQLPPDDPQNPRIISRGKKIFSSRCTQCHGFREMSSPTVPGPTLTEISTVALSRAPEISPADYIKQSVMVPSLLLAEGFESVAKRHPCGTETISRSELNAVTAFLLQ